MISTISHDVRASNDYITQQWRGKTQYGLASFSQVGSMLPSNHRGGLSCLKHSIQRGFVYWEGKPEARLLFHRPRKQSHTLYEGLNGRVLTRDSSRLCCSVVFLTSFHRPTQGLRNNQINIVFHRQNPTALYYHLALWVLRGPCEDAPRLHSSAARGDPSR
jgi:hypothetical protein